MKRVSIKGAIVGGVVDVGVSAILGIPLGVYVASKLDLANIPKEQVGPAIAAAMNGNPTLHFAQLAIGFGCSILGGYVAGRMAKHDQVLNGALSSFLCMAVGIYSVTSGQDTHSRLVQGLLFIASPILGTLGGYLSLAAGGPSNRLQRAAAS